jgi:hypothetical protein
MTESDLKWLFIALGLSVVAPAAGVAVSKYSENNAKRDIIVACYNAGNKDCQNLWATIK